MVRWAPDTADDHDDLTLAAFTFQQADRVHASESALLPERPGVADLYFVGLASWGTQHVFVSESLAAQRLFDARFDTGRRGEVTPGELRALLDEAGIKWRVLMVSSCKSGVFVAPLENEFTLIATASAADAPSLSLRSLSSSWGRRSRQSFARCRARLDGEAARAPADPASAVVPARGAAPSP